MKTLVEFILFLAAGEKGKVMKRDTPSAHEPSIRTKTISQPKAPFKEVLQQSTKTDVVFMGTESRFSFYTSNYLSTSFSK